MMEMLEGFIYQNLKNSGSLVYNHPEVDRAWCFKSHGMFHQPKNPPTCMCVYIHICMYIYIYMYV